MTKIKTTHVGSLPRPAEMMAKLLRKQDVTAVDLKHYLTAILERQLSLGLTYINNGELPRMDYVQSTVSRISGFGATDTAPMPQDLEELPELSRRFGGRNGLITLNPKAPVKLPACSEPIVYTGEASLRDELEMMACVYEKLKPSHLENETALFFTSPSPGTVALFMENKHYQDDEAYIEAIASVLKQEYDIIAGYGFQLQIDCPDLAMGRHTRYKHLTDSAFIDRVHLNVRALNRALSSIDPDRCRVHICWGNYAGTHHCDVNLKTIFNPIMKARARFVSLEASNHRHAHEWVVFKELPFPEEKVLMPGVIDTSSTIVEHPDLVAQRIINFADILGADRVIASTDCGFATTASASAVSGEVAWMKLATLVEGARRASKRFS
jgi:5-methyltetrahydropteroyltriglutamate--homocysteine methyltransferase